MIRLKIKSFVCLLIVWMFWQTSVPCFSQTAETASTVLSPQATEAAVLLGIRPKVIRLIQLKRQRQANGLEAMSDEELALTVDIFDKILGASLEVRMISGRIDRELAWAYSSAGALAARRQRILNYTFTANFMQGGILGILSGPAFLDGHPKTGTELLLVASSIGLGLSVLSLIEQQTGSKAVDGGTTILANVFGLPDPTISEHRYDLVSRYMHSVPPTVVTGKTRVDELMESWKRGHFLRTTSEPQLQRLAAVEVLGKNYRENSSLLNARIRMLFDTQYTVEQLHEGLLDLLRATDLG